MFKRDNQLIEQVTQMSRKGSKAFQFARSKGRSTAA
jgi:hypothetical protein